jgi:hypothetical protein
MADEIVIDLIDCTHADFMQGDSLALPRGLMRQAAEEIQQLRSFLIDAGLYHLYPPVHIDDETAVGEPSDGFIVRGRDN